MGIIRIYTYTYAHLYIHLYMLIIFSYAYAQVLCWNCFVIRWNSSKLLVAVDEGDIEIWECQSPGNTLEKIDNLGKSHHDMALTLSVVEADDNACTGDVVSGGGDGR